MVCGLAWGGSNHFVRDSMSRHLRSCFVDLHRATVYHDSMIVLDYLYCKLRPMTRSQEYVLKNSLS